MDFTGNKINLFDDLPFDLSAAFRDEDKRSYRSLLSRRASYRSRSDWYRAALLLAAAKLLVAVCSAAVAAD